MTAPSDALLESHRQRGLDCLCGNLRMAARAVSVIYDGYLAPAGLTAAQLTVLWCVIASEPVSMQQISEVLAMEKSTVTRNVAWLRRKKLLRVVSGKDARVRQVSASPAGRAAFLRALPHWQAAQKAASKALGGTRFRSLVAGSRRAARLPRAGAGA
jgi:DNA-binding MarR family transcriptional regulator